MARCRRCADVIDGEPVRLKESCKRLLFCDDECKLVYMLEKAVEAAGFAHSAVSLDEAWEAMVTG